MRASVSVGPPAAKGRSEEHTSELQSRSDLVCRLLLEKKKKKPTVERATDREPHHDLPSKDSRHNLHRHITPRAHPSQRIQQATDNREDTCTHEPRHSHNTCTVSVSA